MWTRGDDRRSRRARRQPDPRQRRAGRADRRHDSVDFYAGIACDAPGCGQGAVYLGSTTAIDGHGHFTAAIALPSAGMNVLTATSTGPDDSTSEFSGCAAIP